MKHIFEIRLWTGDPKKPEQWIAKEEPEYLGHGSLRFRAIDGIEHVIHGTYAVAKREERREGPRS
jgi:hypothetical protein